MDSEVHDWLRRRWERDLPNEPFPFTTQDHPQDIVAEMGKRLGILAPRVTNVSPLVVGPRPCKTPEPEPTKKA